MKKQLVSWLLFAVALLFFTNAIQVSAQTACPAPYHVLAQDGRCVWSCGEGTTPDNKTNECVCKPGLKETGKDKFGRRICSKAPDCPKPYHVVAPDGRCVWSCSEGTTPDNKTNECVCKPGLKETGKDKFGRRVCQ